MNIASTQYTLDYESYEIYLSGCDGRCGNACHNKELWNFNLGNNWTDKIDNIVNRVNEFNSLIKWVWIMGGEPLLQDSIELEKLIIKLKKETNNAIVLFTRFELDEIPKEILLLCDYIKTGKYDKTLVTDNNEYYGIKLATSNQKVFRI